MQIANCLAALAAGVVLAGGALAQTDRLEAARRHVVRGTAAVEMAKSPRGLADAAAEFRKATEIAPEMEIAWFNLGAVEAKLGHHGVAIEAYRRYLTLSPKAADARKVQDEIIKLEYQQERYEESIKPGWQLVGVDIQNGRNRSYFIDRSRIQKSAEGNLVPVIYDYEQGFQWGPSFLVSYSSSLLVDCPGKRMKYLGSSYYSEHMGGGKAFSEVDSTKNFPNGLPWQQVTDNRMDEAFRQLFEAACRYQ